MKEQPDWAQIANDSLEVCDSTTDPALVSIAASLRQIAESLADLAYLSRQPQYVTQVTP